MEATGSARTAENASPRQVLVVDDSTHIREFLVRCLNGSAALHVCGEAANGEEGVTLAKQRTPDVIILDQEMPVLDGLSALAPLREAVPSATIVMFSATPDPSVRERAQALGADAFFAKGPADMVSLLRFLGVH